ncbi:MAG: nucleotidyltransferase domain-containing protein [Anaerolineae bacterium]|nr:nucleotidyltransferase domain-containing protein [Anaerolineae bacterium]MCX8068741.1 nucleotidyltransferase domain-containing protein [Anaerolineae bacterium]MDW7990633.1 nucleotidyltransferase domain-containing protein [Anaerolineae bacterium]
MDQLLSSPVRPYIAKIFLFGGAAAGGPHPESDVDIRLVGTDHLREIEARSSEVAYRVLLETGEGLSASCLQPGLMAGR